MACRNNACCWCDLCQGRRLQTSQHMSLEALLGTFKLHKVREDRCLDQLFEEVLQTSAYGKLIKLAIQRETPYSKPGNFFRYSDRFQHLDQKHKKELAKNINDAAWVYDNISEVAYNFDLVRKDAEVDIRRLSISQLYHAKDLNWCHQYAASLAIRGKKPENVSYTDDQFNILLQKIMEDDCFKAVDGDATNVASLGARIQTTLLRRMTKDLL